MKLPFVGILASTIIYVYDLDKVKELLKYFGVPLLSDTQILGLRVKIWGERVQKRKINAKKHKISLLDKLKLTEFKEFFIEEKFDQDFEDAINLHRFRDYRIPLQAYIITGDKEFIERFIPFEVSDKTVKYFEKYFFNIQTMSPTDWIKYLQILKAQYPEDAELIVLIKKKDYTTFKLKMGRLAKIDMEDMLDIANSISFMMFRQNATNPFNSKEAIKWGDLFAKLSRIKLLTKELPQQAQLDFNPEEFELKPVEYEIPVLRGNAPKSSNEKEH